MSRERVFYNQNSFGNERSFYRRSANNYAYDTQISYPKVHYYSAMSDIVTDRFNRLSRQGHIITNPCLKVESWYENQPGILESGGICNSGEYHEWRNVFSLDQLTDPVTQHLIPLPTKTLLNAPDYVGLYQDQIDLAVTRAWSNVSLTEMMSLATLGEAGKTITGITKIFKGFIDLLYIRRYPKKIAQLKSLSGKQYRDGLANLWLELRYGVRPLVYDLMNLLKALKKVIDRNNRLTARGRSLITEQESTVLTGVSEDFAFSFSHTVNVQHSFRAGVLFKIEDDLNALISVWGLDAPLQAVWELIPFSFIIDWFFNVGDTIAAWVYKPNLSPLSSWVTSRCKVEGTIRYNSMTDANRTTRCSSNDYYRLTQYPKCDYRVIIMDRAVSPPRSVIPTFNLRLDVAKLTDLVLIGRQILLKH